MEATTAFLKKRPLNGQDRDGINNLIKKFEQKTATDNNVDGKVTPKYNNIMDREKLMYDRKLEYFNKMTALCKEFEQCLEDYIAEYENKSLHSSGFVKEGGVVRERITNEQQYIKFKDYLKHMRKPHEDNGMEYLQEVETAMLNLK
jgi:hypothetical protein